MARRFQPVATSFNTDPRKAGVFERKFAQNLRSGQRPYLQRAGRKIVRYLRVASRGVHYKGRYRKGWYAKVMATKLKIGNKARHAIFVEKGRGAGKPMPPLGVIAQWAQDKGIPKEAVYPIARAIGRRGIPPRPTFYTRETQREIRSIVSGELGDFYTSAFRKSM